MKLTTHFQLDQGDVDLYLVHPLLHRACVVLVKHRDNFTFNILLLSIFSVTKVFQILNSLSSNFIKKIISEMNGILNFTLLVLSP
jgi:hypothetical protein